ncbi:MAG: response regulator [Campylobacterota bacterium]|nr:response regulator [Campylobacterota bacterium]
MKIIYIDSDKIYSKKLLDKLIDKNYEVKFISNSNDAIIESSFFEPDILICDDSNINIIKKLKEQFKELKTIVLAKNPSQEFFVSVISLKIDQLILHYNDIEDILLKIKEFNISDNEEEIDDTILHNLGENYYYDINGFRIVNGNNIIQLTPQENKLITILVKAHGHYQSPETLQKALGKVDSISIDTLRTLIKKIRKKTYTDIIKNKSGIGYSVNYQMQVNITSKVEIDSNMRHDIKALILKGDKKKNDLLQFYLRKLGLDCESVYTIEDAKTLLDLGDYDYIISDLSLPDGEIVDIIKDSSIYTNGKFIILSHDSDIHYKEYLYFKGIIDYILENDDINYIVYDIYQTISKVESNKSHNDILLIEQSKKTSQQIRDILNPRGYNVTIVNKLENGYELCKNIDFSLIILDISLDNVYSFISDVKVNINNNIPFIMLTDTNRTYETVKNAYKNGINECLRRPIFAEEFILKVDQLSGYSKMLLDIKDKIKVMDDYQKIVDNTTIVSKTDIKGNITYVNDLFCKISGYTKDELLGKPHNLIRDPKTSKEIFKNMWHTIKDKKQIWTGVITNKAKDGSTYTVDTSIMPITNNNGEIVEFIALRKEIN